MSEKSLQAKPIPVFEARGAGQSGLAAATGDDPYGKQAPD